LSETPDGGGRCGPSGEDGIAVGDALSGLLLLEWLCLDDMAAYRKSMVNLPAWFVDNY
jgi:hypothetical protein